MNRMSLYIKIIFCILITSIVTYSQTASTTAGCAELKVNFTAPTAASYYWIFGDGPSNISNLQNPEHSYVQPGEYTAQLFDQENGTQVGDDIIITVYPPIVIMIDADMRTGCAPLLVNFTSSIDIHPDIIVDDIVWTFGDGNSASGQNTSYNYMDNGTFTVSVKVITSNDIACDEPVIFEDYITLEGEQTNFLINKYTSCDVPSDFIFTNVTNGEPGTTYEWDFGNTQTSSDEGPHTITYDSEGLFVIKLTSTTESGCVSSFSRTISIGAPLITTTFPDTICLGVPTDLTQTTIANEYFWDFTGTSIDTSYSGGFTSEEKRPEILFNSPGLQTFTLTATAIDGCESTVTLEVFVFTPDASFTVGPESSCADPILIEYTANDPNLFAYTFNNDVNGEGEDVMRFTPTGSNLYEHPIRDEYYINFQDSVNTRLIVLSNHGCIDTAYNSYLIQKPEAFFIPDVVKGCIPFEVNFSDMSFATADIQVRDWDYGDGLGDTFGPDDTLVSHVYNTTGFHEVVLTVTDENGCIDVSRKIEIIAIDKDTFEGIPTPFVCPELIFCVGDTVSLGVLTDQINTNLHIESDEGRFDHCWKEVVANHAFQYPGVYPISATLEFYTIFIDSLGAACEVTIEGSHSDIAYSIDCANPYDVYFNGKRSINADAYDWYLDDQIISSDESFTHTFENRGTYTVYLETSQNGVNCSHRDSAVIHITEIIADINIPDKTCVTEPTPLNAELSQDVHNKCQAGYIWQFEDQRPREVNDSIIDHNLKPGFQTITLIVEDINGCTDTISSTTTAYDLKADFNTDSLICLPSDVSMLDFSFGDTTVVSWNWEFGGGTSDIQNPTHEFTEADYDPDLGGDSISVTLTIEDAIGCMDDTTLIIQTYDIFSNITMDNGPVICQNEIITFDADDYNLGGSSLSYEWDFGTYGTSTEDNPSVTFTEPGEQLISLLFTEIATGCQGTLDTLINVTPTPDASFISNHDSTEFICFPEQLSFTNTSIVDGDVIYSWDFDNGAQSDIEDPVIPFDKGTYNVQLIVSTFEGCRDTFNRTYTLVGPEGTFTVDKDLVCPGEEITLTLANTTDVSSYTWDFGDGVQIDDQSPVTHIYNQLSSVNIFTPTLILRSDENGCELIQNIPITVSSITADFIDSSGFCPGELTLFSTFEDPQSIEWNIDGQIISNTSNPSVVITSEDPTIDVTLSVTDINGCVIERMRTVDNPDRDLSLIKYPNVFSPNGDSVNPTFNIYYDMANFERDVEVVEFKVYNRWGELLYNNDNPALGWDGSYKGSIVPPDIYAYYIEVSIDGCLPRSKKGNVTVIK